MIRILSVAVFGALVAALFLAPAVSPGRLATKQVAGLLDEDAELLGPDGSVRTDDDGAPLTRPLWRVMVESDAVGTDVGEDGEPQPYFQIGGGRFLVNPEILSEADRESGDYARDQLVWHGEALKAVVRKLRANVAEEEIDLRIDAYKRPDPSGFNLEMGVKPGSIKAVANIAGEPVASVERPWAPVTQLSLLPPLIAIFLAILFRRPVLALFFGVWSGAFLVARQDGGAAVGDLGSSLGEVFSGYLVDQLADNARREIIAFVVLMLAMVGVLTRAGGIRGVMNRISTLAKDARRTQIATWFMGLAIFFDDYANSILVGSTMRPLADRFKVAREKLAYIVDSTAAPVAGVSLLSTWIAFEVSTFSAQLPDAGLAPSDGYAVFLNTLPFRFYCWFTLLFVGLIVFTGRDFGPMLAAERRARRGEILRPGATPLVGKAATDLEADESIDARASTALVPLGLFILTTLATIAYVGSLGCGLLVREEGAVLPALGEAPGGALVTMTEVLFQGSGEFPLMIGAAVGFVAAALLAVLRGLAVKKILLAAFNSIRATGVAIVILYLAWMVGAVCSDLGTANYLSALLYGGTPHVVLPVALFLLAGLIAFSTGSSWSTMTILLPLVVGLTYDIGYRSGVFETEEAARAAGLFLMTVSIGAVLEGAIFGDHCSPISDTTVMSSIACASDHVDHVRTQAPYAILTMSVAVVFGYLPVVFFGLSPWIALALGAAALVLFLRLKGERADAPDPAAGAA